MKVYVVMQADFPQAVLDDEALAQKIAAERNEAERKSKGDPLAGYWRVHSFTLNQAPT